MANEESSSKSPYLIRLLLLLAAVIVAMILLWQIMSGDEDEAPLTLEDPVTQTEPVPPLSTEPDPEPEPEPEPEPLPEPEQAPEEVVQTPEPEPLPNLADSDTVALAAAEELSPDQALRDLLVEDSVIQKSVRALIGFASGSVVNEYRPIQSPEGDFLVEKLDELPDEEVGQRYRMSAENYARYEPYVDVVTSLDARNVAGLYRRFYPLLREAYGQQGLDRGTFREVTLDAIDTMLAAPVLEEEPILIQPKVHFQYQDQELENLPGPQKLLIRMGPENTRRIKATLRDLREELVELELPEGQ